MLPLIIENLSVRRIYSKKIINLELEKFLNKRTGKLRLAITADHSTWSKEGTYIDYAVPVILHRHRIKPDSVKEFDLHQVLKGELGRFSMFKTWDKFSHN